MIHDIFHYPPEYSLFYLLLSPSLLPFLWKTIIVPDVSKFPKYIACDSLTKSEIAVPVTRQNKLIAVLDVDSTELNSFNVVDKSYLELIVKTYFED